MNKLFFGFFDGSFVERPEDEAGYNAEDNWLGNVIFVGIDEFGVLEDFTREKIDKREDDEPRNGNGDDLDE